MKTPAQRFTAMSKVKDKKVQQILALLEKKRIHSAHVDEQDTIEEIMDQILDEVV